MIFGTRQRVRRVILISALLAASNAVCKAEPPAQRPDQKGGKHHVQKGHRCPLCHPCVACHKRVSHHWMPPAPPSLPVIQSQAVRSVPAEAEAVRMRLQVRAEQRERPREPFRERERPREPFEERPRPRERYEGPPHQKPQAPSQKTYYRSASAEISDLNERFNRLEHRVDLLLQKLEGFAREVDK